MTQFYKYCWGNNEKRATMKGRTCRVLSRGKKNSCSIEFIDNGQKEIVSRNALRKTKANILEVTFYTLNEIIEKQDKRIEELEAENKKLIEGQMAKLQAGS